jgi:hypothetical protein
MALINQGESQSFFAAQQISPDDVDLISDQIDPTQPQVSGTSRISNPIIPDRTVATRVLHLDPDLYDLRDSSHLMRLIKVLLGAPGAGGLRKQISMVRMSGSLSGTHFLDLDGFWGALFGISRISTESMPINADGTSFNPMTQSADFDTWDDVSARDGHYRSRITQFARAVGQGGTYFGILAAVEALLGTEVDMLESWTLADLIPPGTVASAINANTYIQVESKYPTYAAMNGVPWGTLVGGVQSPGQTPLGNRAEVIVRPRRNITQEEKRQVSHVLDAIAPAGTLMTVLDAGLESQAPVPMRSAWSDSENWNVVSSVVPASNLLTPTEEIYPNQGQYQGARPAFSAYTGESFSYNSRITAIKSYQMVDDKVSDANSDYQSVTFLDGQRTDYTPAQAVMSAHQAILSRIASEGVLTAYPYAGARS